MIVILAVALIVVGPDKLPDLARSLAKGVLDLKRALNQVKDSLADEDNLLGSVHKDLRKTADELKSDLNDSSSEHFTFREPPGSAREAEEQDGDIIDVEAERAGDVAQPGQDEQENLAGQQEDEETGEEESKEAVKPVDKQDASKT